MPNLQGRMWRLATAEPQQTDTTLAEHLRVLSSITRPCGTVVSLVPGKAVSASEVHIDAVTRPIEMYVRARAWFCTMAFVSIRKPTFFDYQTAIYGSDRILSFVSQTFGGFPAPTSHYIDAWAGTVHHFAEQVRVNKMTLREAVLGAGNWEHKWTNYTPQVSSGSQGSQGQGSQLAIAAGAAADMPADLAAEVARLRKEVGQWQSVADRHRSQLESGQGSGFQIEYPQGRGKRRQPQAEG